jgi:hypothetical protein
MDQKLCRICGKLKDFEDFKKNDEMKDGHRNECKKCFNKLKQKDIKFVEFVK